MSVFARVGSAVLGFLAGALCLQGGAQAFWEGVGGGEGLAQVATLSTPTLRATSETRAVRLSWSAAPPPEAATAVTYFVRRNGRPPSGGCPTETAPTTETSCLETGMNGGEKATFTVVAVWRTWFAESEPVTAVANSAPPAYLELSAAKTAVQAGEGDPLTVIARAANGELATGFSGTHPVTFGGARQAPNGAKPTVSSESGTALPFGEQVPLYFNAGVATVSGTANGLLTLYRAEKTTVIAKSEGLSNEASPLVITVAPGPFGQFTAAAQPASPTAGQAFALRITALDRFGNLDTGYTARSAFTFGGALPSPAPVEAKPVYPSGVIPPFSNGEATVQGFVFYRAGSTTVSIEETGSGNRGGASLTILPGAAASLTLSATKSSVAVGEQLAVTVRALDGYGNLATSFGGAGGETKEATFSGAQAGPNGTQPTATAYGGQAVPFGKATALRFVEGVATTAFTPYRVETAQLVATIGSLSNKSAPLALTVVAGAAKSFAVTASTTAPTAGEPLSLHLTALDQGGNVATSFGGAAGETRTLTYAGAQPSPNGTAPSYPESATAVSFKEGVGTATGIVLYKAGATTLTVSSGPVSGTVTVNVKPGPVSGLAWSEPTVSGGTLEPGCALTCVVTNLESGGVFQAAVAVSDRYGNPQPNHERLAVYLMQRILRGFAFGQLSSFFLEIGAGQANSERFTLTVYSFNFGQRGGGYELELQAVPVGQELPTATARISGP